MKKIVIRLVLCSVLVVIFSGAIAIAQPSGWEDKGDYKEQRLVKPGLQAVAVSPDSSTLYTLHDNKIVYYWDVGTGTLVDSLIISESNLVCYFSKDGKNIIYTYPGRLLQIGAASQLAIVDLSSKKQICKSGVSIPGNIPNDLPYNNPYYLYSYSESNIRFTFVDYNSTTKKCYCGFSFDYEKSTIGITAESSTTKGFGGSAIFDVKPDTIIPIRNFSIYPASDILISDSLAFFTDFKYTYQYGRVGTIIKYTNVSKEWVAWYTNLNKDTALIARRESYERKYEWNERTGVKESVSGRDCPLTKLFYHRSSNRLFVKADSVYYGISIKNKPSIKDTIYLQRNAICEYLDDINDKFFYVAKFNIIVIDINDKYNIETIMCPIVPNDLRLLHNGKDILITDRDGRMVLFENYPMHYLPRSGWKITSNKKEQILKLDNLTNVAYSSERATLYSLHDNRTVWYWDAKTGVRFDSLNVDSASVAVFSKDGKTLCVYTKMPDSDKNNATTTLTVYYLPTKSVFFRKEIDFPGLVKCDVPLKFGLKVSSRRFTTLDYNCAWNDLTAGIAFQYDLLSGTEDVRLSSFTLGGAARCYAYNDSWSIETPISSQMPFCIITTGDYTFSTLYTNQFEKSSYKGVDSIFTTCNFILRKTDMNTGKSEDLISNSYEKIDKYANGKHELDMIVGAFKPLTNLFYIDKYSSLLVREEDAYYTYNIKSNQVTDTLSLLPGAALETLSRDSSALYFSVGKEVYLLDIFTKEILDTIRCDFEPVALCLAPDGILAGGAHGEMAIYKEKPKSALDWVKYSSLLINPNPARNELFLPTNGDLTGKRVEIYTQAGAKALEAPYSERVDISSLPVGMYFLRVGNRIGKFVKE